MKQIITYQMIQFVTFLSWIIRGRSTGDSPSRSGHVNSLTHHPQKGYKELPGKRWSSWWLKPTWKNISQIGSFPQGSGWKKKYLSCHHLVVVSPFSIHLNIGCLEFQESSRSQFPHPVTMSIPNHGLKLLSPFWFLYWYIYTLEDISPNFFREKMFFLDFQGVPVDPVVGDVFFDTLLFVVFCWMSGRIWIKPLYRLIIPGRCGKNDTREI